MEQLKEEGNVTNYGGLPEEKKENRSNFLETIIKFNGSRLEKYKAENHSIEKLKHLTI
jgi:hypothetical protein